jgi:hypothetical protein
MVNQVGGAALTIERRAAVESIADLLNLTLPNLPNHRPLAPGARDAPWEV